jgi:hypothetical protein
MKWSRRNQQSVGKRIENAGHRAGFANRATVQVCCLGKRAREHGRVRIFACAHVPVGITYVRRLSLDRKMQAVRTARDTAIVCRCGKRGRRGSGNGLGQERRFAQGRRRQCLAKSTGAKCPSRAQRVTSCTESAHGQALPVRPRSVATKCAVAIGNRHEPGGAVVRWQRPHASVREG